MGVYHTSVPLSHARPRGSFPLYLRCAPHRQAFTVVELVVVIAILALAMAVIVPALVGTKSLQQRSSCATALHNIGVAAWSYSLDYRSALPTHVAGPQPFDTVQMASGAGDWMNLGLLQDYVGAENSFFCPTQDAARSPAIAYNSHNNKWKTKHPRKQDDADGQELNSSFAARPLLQAQSAVPSWRTHNYHNRVIYTDFLGVDKWQGRNGRLIGPLFAAHDGRGYNRLFGDGSVRWVDQGPLQEKRPIRDQLPAATDMNDYYMLLDVLP